MRPVDRRPAAPLLALALAVSACAGSTTGELASDSEVEATPALAAPAALEVDRPAPNSADTADLAAGLNDLGIVVFLAAAEREAGQDVVVSPLSIGVAFGMADVGASGATADELTELFDFPVDGDARWAAFNTLEQGVSSDDGPTVRLANRLFPDQDFVLVDGYDETLARWFGARAEPLPLRARPDPSRLRINEWVAAQTQDLIADLLAPGAITPQTALVLVNALYLEAEWATPFGKYATEDLPFTLADGSTVTVPLMHELELTGPAVVGEDYTATEVPYVGGDLSMLVVVPAEGRFEPVQARLADGLLTEVDATATTGPVELWLPRFRSDTALDLEEVFEEDLGTQTIFGPGGTWDGISPGVFLDSGVHAADITVDEQGTVAAAATALSFLESGPPEPEVLVRADRPFLYVIRHRPTGAVLFVGRVMDPSA